VRDLDEEFGLLAFDLGLFRAVVVIVLAAAQDDLGPERRAELEVGQRRSIGP
jgi:hypothetical protein